jgi:hypothetical protein
MAQVERPWLNIKKAWIAHRARLWDDRYYRIYNCMDCGASVAETVRPELLRYRLKWESLCREHGKLREQLEKPSDD